jgi:endoglucanase
MPVSTKLLHEMCALPTAAFLEDAVYAYVDRWLRRRPELAVRKDKFGNRLVVLKGTDSKAPRLVLVAHTDHPAFVAGQTADDGTLFCEFRGGVFAENCRKAKVRFFAPGGEVVASVRSVEAGEADRLKSATFKPKQPVPPGTIGMFDEGEPTETGGVFRSRACDDLAGCASALAALDLLRRNPPRSSVAVLLTRAEEVGFVGAIAAAQERSLLRKSDRVISIETSSVQPFSPQGKGVILRVGDRISIFNSALSYFLAQQGDALAKSRSRFAYQRALMPGGACEGTVFDAFGYVTAAVCVALGNYHNMDRPRHRTGPEFISVSDWQSMVTLFVAAARNLHEFDGTHAALRKRLDQRFDNHRHLFRDPAASLERKVDDM